MTSSKQKLPFAVREDEEKQEEEVEGAGKEKEKQGATRLRRGPRGFSSGTGWTGSTRKPPGSRTHLADGVKPRGWGCKREAEKVHGKRG